MYRSVKVLIPGTAQEAWLVVDEGEAPHAAYLSYTRTLLQRKSSVNTQRAYATRVARFLSWCESSDVRWSAPGLSDMTRYKADLEKTSAGMTRSAQTVEGHLTAVLSFLRHSVAEGVVAPEVTGRFTQTKTLRSTGDRSTATVTVERRHPTLKARTSTKAPKAVSEEDAGTLIATCRTDRDRFLITLMLRAGLRVGEALGLRRSDLHLAQDSTPLGCDIPGSHVHVVKREDNPNGALAKSSHPRIIPLTEEVRRRWDTYASERRKALEDDTSDFLFVNYVGTHAGNPMGYQNTIRLISTLGERAGVHARPHMLRHSAATSWVRAGVALDVVRSLLGHASLESTTVYLHATNQDLRDAVERVQGQGAAE